MSVFKSLQFDDINTLDKGVYISGEGAYNAPERDVELISIPGRNGDFILDNKRFKNIEVTYKAGIKGVDQYEFRNKFQQFRTLMASKRGYKRLTDEYNPNEYRLASFVDAIEAEAVDRAAEFDIIFNCKPQRFLLNGDSAVSVPSGYSINNITPFDASPMIMVEGHGGITVNGYDINIVNEYVGDVTFASQESWTAVSEPKLFTINPELLNSGDTITVSGGNASYVLKPVGKDISNLEPAIIEQTNGTVQISHKAGTKEYTIAFVMGDVTFIKGTPLNGEGSFTIKTHYNRGTQSESVTYKVVFNFVYNGDSAIRVYYTFTTTSGVYGAVAASNRVAGIHNIKGYSTISTLGHPTYIDCDLGEVYLIDNGSFVSLNHLTDLGSNLPVLSPGENVIKYDDTITSFEIIPRWWVL